MAVAEDYQKALGEAHDLGAVSRIVRTATRAIAGSQGGTFVLRDGENCFYADEDAIAPLWKGQRFPLTACISGWAMLHDDTAVVPDIEKDDRIPIEVYRPTFVRSLVMVPVGSPKPIATIGAYWSFTHEASRRCVEQLQELADLTAEAVERIGLDEAPWAPTFTYPTGRLEQYDA